MSHKEDESNKIPCPVCGKMISKTMGRAVHEKSKYHQEALKRKEGGGAAPEVKPPVVEEKPPVNSGIAGKDKPPEKNEEKKSGGGIKKFLDWIEDDGEDDDW